MSKVLVVVLPRGSVIDTVVAVLVVRHLVEPLAVGDPDELPRGIAASAPPTYRRICDADRVAGRAIESKLVELPLLPAD